jgi:hypothetical protein
MTECRRVRLGFSLCAAPSFKNQGMSRISEGRNDGTEMTGRRITIERFIEIELKCREIEFIGLLR